jgi:phosphatidylserine decarboxylase
MTKTTFYRLLTELSARPWISRGAGAFAKSSLSKGMIRGFAKAYQIPLAEAEHAVDHYPTLNAFFTRRLKPGARLIDGEASTIVSPVDAQITAKGVIADGLMLQVKGQTYTIDELLDGSERAEKYKRGYFFVLYLSPRDYHRIHVPVTGTIVEKQPIAGRVYPVNHMAMTNVPQVLSRNYRIASYIKHDNGEVAVVKVGALNVASIQFVEDLHDQVNKGDELAYFEFGSTIVLLMQEGTFSPRADLLIGSRVKMGEGLGITL